MRSWKMDGWSERDWDNITEDASALLAVAREFDDAVGGGGGGFEPAEVAGFADRLQAMAERLRLVAGGYL